MELDFALANADINAGEGGTITLDLPTYNVIKAALPSSVNGAKFRITSLVIDPVSVMYYSGSQSSPPQEFFGHPPVVAYDFNAQASDNHWQPTDINKPLRVRFSKEYGGDGRWVKVLANGNVNADAFGDGSSIVGVIQVDQPTMPVGLGEIWGSAFTEVHIRVAFTDN